MPHTPTPVRKPFRLARQRLRRRCGPDRGCCSCGGRAAGPGVERDTAAGLLHERLVACAGSSGPLSSLARTRQVDRLAQRLPSRRVEAANRQPSRSGLHVFGMAGMRRSCDASTSTWPGVAVILAYLCFLCGIPRLLRKLESLLRGSAWLRELVDAGNALRRIRCLPAVHRTGASADRPNGTSFHPRVRDGAGPRMFGRSEWNKFRPKMAWFAGRAIMSSAFEVARTRVKARMMSRGRTLQGSAGAQL